MNEFFEVNLPDSAPGYLVGAQLRKDFEAAVASIKRRSAKLNAALNSSVMEPNKFHAIARTVFDMNPVRFDSMSVDELTGICEVLDDGEPVIPREEWPAATVLFDTAFTLTSEWESLRHIGIGGSESSIVMGCSPYSTQRRLFHEKVGASLANQKSGSPVFDRGHMTESRVVEFFCQKTGATRIPESRMFASKAFPNSTANIDAIVRMPDGSLYIFEAKTSKEENRKAWVNEKVPRNYITQTHQYPAVLNDDRIRGTFISCMFVVDYDVDDFFIACTFDGQRNITELIERDLDYERDLLEAEDDFWNEYIVPGVEPEAGDPELELAFLDTMNGPADPQQAYLDLPDTLLPDIEEWLRLNEERLTLNKKAKALGEQQDALKCSMVSLLGTEVEGRFPISEDEYYEVRYSPSRDSCSVDADALAIAFPEAFHACMKHTPGSRRFSVKKVKTKKARK